MSYSEQEAHEGQNSHHCTWLCACRACRICAIQADWPEGAEALIASGAAVDARSAAADTPLLWAAFKGLLPVCQALIGAGADVNVMGGLGNRPLHIAVSADHQEVSAAAAHLLAKTVRRALPAPINHQALKR
jgi:ankyrin repeat protein